MSHLTRSVNIVNLSRKCVPIAASQSLHTSSTVKSSKNRTGDHAKYFPAMRTPMLPPGSFKDRTVFLTGGGTGLGKGMAEMMSGLGANVVIASRRLPVLESTAAAISSKTGGKVLPVQMDVRQPDAVARAFDLCEQEFGLPNAVINNAAGNFVSPSERLSPNAWKTIVDIVLNGTANVTLEAGRRLIKAKQGCAFLAITTPYSRTGSGFVCPSSSAKAGVESMAKSLCSEWGRYGMRFNCLAPGPVETEGAFSRLDPSGKFRDVVHERIPVGRMGEVEEIANLATYLVSDFGSWISGQTFDIDGGEVAGMSGAFNLLSNISNEQWDMMEKKIRDGNKADKDRK